MKKFDPVNIIIILTIPIWIIPFIVYYLWDWGQHQEDYLKKKEVKHE